MLGPSPRVSLMSSGAESNEATSIVWLPSAMDMVDHCRVVFSLIASIYSVSLRICWTHHSHPNFVLVRFKYRLCWAASMYSRFVKHKFWCLLANPSQYCRTCYLFISVVYVNLSHVSYARIDELHKEIYKTHFCTVPYWSAQICIYVRLESYIVSIPPLLVHSIYNTSVQLHRSPQPDVINFPTGLRYCR